MKQKKTNFDKPLTEAEIWEGLLEPKRWTVETDHGPCFVSMQLSNQESFIWNYKEFVGRWDREHFSQCVQMMSDIAPLHLWRKTER